MSLSNLVTKNPLIAFWIKESQLESLIYNQFYQLEKEIVIPWGPLKLKKKK